MNGYSTAYPANGYSVSLAKLIKYAAAIDYERPIPDQRWLSETEIVKMLSATIEVPALDIAAKIMHARRKLRLPIGRFNGYTEENESIPVNLPLPATKKSVKKVLHPFEER